MARLRAVREARGITQREMAQLVGWSQPTLSQRETGQTRLTIEQAEAYARALGIQITFVVREEPAPLLPEHQELLHRLEALLPRLPDVVVRTMRREAEEWEAELAGQSR